MATYASRAQQISNILDLRRPLVQRIATLINHLDRRSKVMQELETLRDEIVGSAEVEEQLKVEQLKDIQFAEIQHAIKAAQEELKRLKSRFERPTLNVGVIGRARQGKSRLLQSLSGLSHFEIPDGDNQACTGVRSTIYNLSDLNKDPYAVVYFYTEQELLYKVITPYYEALGLSPVPTSFSDFLKTNVAMSLGYASDKAKWEHLLDYQKHIKKYQDLLGQQPQEIATSAIRQFVAQDDEEGHRVYFNYLAVREVRIYCRFPHADDVGQIALIDMPGLGDTGVGDDKRLIQALAHDIDFALIVRMPKSTGDFWADYDMDLYDLPQRSGVKLPIKDWSFMVLNHTTVASQKGENLKHCEQLQTDLSPKSSSSAGRHIRVSECIIADCSDSSEVSIRVLDTMLAYLVNHIARLDNEYASYCQDILSEVDNKILLLLHAAKLAEPTSLGDSDSLFEDEFEKVWQQLTHGLEVMMRKLQAHRDIDDEHFKEYFDTTFENCLKDSHIPESEEDIRRRRDEEGAYGIPFEKYLMEMRTHLTYHFIDIDTALKKSMDETKEEIAGVLRKEGLLEHITSEKGGQFFEAMLALIPSEQAEWEKLNKLFTIMAKYHLSYRGFFQHRIRVLLDDLNPDNITAKPDITNLRAELEQRYSDTIDKLRIELYQHLAEPSMASFAIAEELVDQLLRSRYARRDLRRFYSRIREEVWPKEFGRISYWKEIQTRWSSSVREMEIMLRLYPLQLLSL